MEEGLAKLTNSAKIVSARYDVECERKVDVMLTRRWYSRMSIASLAFMSSDDQLLV